jgi:hypothetical protein
MPPKLERCVKSVKKQGHNKKSAFRICNASIKGKKNHAKNRRSKNKTNTRRTRSKK